MRLALGDPVVATLIAPADPPPDMGARIEVPYTRAIVSYWQLATVIEGDDGFGNDTLLWHVILDAPLTAGDYLIVWRTGDPEPPDLETFIPLMVT